MKKLFFLSLCLFVSACSHTIDGTKQDAHIAADKVSDTAKTVAKDVKDVAVDAYHGAAKAGKKVGHEAAEAGHEVAQKARKTFGSDSSASSSSASPDAD